MPEITSIDTRRLQGQYDDAMQALRQFQQESARVAGERAEGLRQTIDDMLAALQSLIAQARARLEAPPVLLSTVRQQADSLRGLTEGMLATYDGDAAGAVRDNVARQLRQASQHATELTERALEMASRQAGLAQEKVATVKQRAASAADLVASQQDGVGQLLAGLAAQALERASQAGAQARDVAGTQAAGLAQTLAQQKETVAPALADLAGQARERMAQAGSQATGTLQSATGPLAETAAGTAAAVGGAMEATGRTIKSTIRNLIWITILAGLAVLLYAPRDEDRARLQGKAQEWLSFIVDLAVELRGGQ